MYTEAYKSYDFTNHILSFFGDSSIREAAAEEIIRLKPHKIIDVATGTGDMAINMAKLSREQGLDADITGLDINPNMLKVAKAKAKKAGLRNVRFEIGDILHLRYPDSYFDAVSCSFSVKNFGDLDKFAIEAYRILKKHGTLLIADISMPEGIFKKIIFYFYLSYMRVIGFTTGKELYKWLPGSTAQFNRANFIKILRRNGFANLKKDEFFFGIAYILTCNK